MFKCLLATALLLLVQSASAQSLTESSNSPCQLVTEAIEANSIWTGEMVKLCGSEKLNILNHGFDLTCLSGLKNVQLITKVEAAKVKSFISIFAVHEVERGIELQFVRTTNGINQTMERVVLKKTKGI